MKRVMRMWCVLASVGLVVSAGGITERAQSGSLEPPASAVDGNGNPVHTEMSQPEVPQSLDHLFTAANGIVAGQNAGCGSDRFTCLWPDGTGKFTAVRDNETGLVWERQPSPVTQTWFQARMECLFRTVGGRKGWRLPLMHELLSLQVPPAFVPTGHPFLLQEIPFPFIFWSVTTESSDLAYSVEVNNVRVDLKSGPRNFWCVRGGLNHGSKY